MTSLSAETIKNILDAVTTYPYEIKFFTYEPRFPLYPYCVIRKSQPQGSVKTITDVTKQEGFEITFHIRYNRDFTEEERDQTEVEEIIISTLEGVDFGTNALFSESKSWQRSPLEARGVFGSKSRLLVSVVDKQSKSGSGILGYTDKIELNSDSTPVQIQCLSFNETYGSAVESHYDDSLVTRLDPTTAGSHFISFTYESTAARDTLFKTLTDSRSEIKGKVLRGGVTTKYLFLVGNTVRSGQFDNIERATTTIYINGSWN